ncbi:hypothetical protein [Paraburkholderia kururiensis]|uniref:hypothetical protein n=1 Tax=Paraburkholderia kururiensis TaxID=984307 RepID=UPI0012DFFFFB|nr:hypothetical protein [Paraburkholderia kururiensis]
MVSPLIAVWWLRVRECVFLCARATPFVLAAFQYRRRRSDAIDADQGCRPYLGFCFFVYKEGLAGLYLIRKKLDLDMHSGVGHGADQIRPIQTA